MDDSTPATRRLDELGVPYRLFQHAGPLNSLEQAARERGQEPGQVVRSLLFRLPGEQYVLVLVAGPSQVSWPALRRFLGQSRLTTARDEEVLAVTGFEPGTVSPFGLTAPVRVLVDESVLAPEQVSLGSGQRGLAIVIKTTDLLKALGQVESGRFT